MNQTINEHFCRKCVLFWVLALFLFGVVSITMGSSETRLLQEIVSADQTLKRVQGMPVIISKKEYVVSLSPESIITKPQAPIIFTMVIKNPFKDPLQFSMKDVRCYSNKNDLRILESDEVLKEARAEFPKEEYQLSKEQEQELASYIEDKMQMLNDKLLKTQTIAPNSQIIGRIYIQVPQGTERLTIEVIFPQEKHKFDFNVVES